MSGPSRQGFLGSDQDRVLAELKIAVVGLGGGGAALCQQLAHIGFTNYLLIDPDRIEDTNLNRLIGGMVADVQRRERKIDIAARGVLALRPAAKIRRCFSKWQDAAEELKTCDVVVGAVDGYLQRSELEAFCRRFLMPYVDIGMDVIALPDGTYLISGQVITSLPGSPCMRCCHFLTDERLTEEAEKYGAAGIRAQVIWPNGVLASAAIGELMSLVLPWYPRKATFNHLIYDGNKNQLVPSPHVKALEGTECPHFPWTQVGDPLFKVADQIALPQPRAGLWAWLMRLVGRGSTKH